MAEHMTAVTAEQLRDWHSPKQPWREYPNGTLARESWSGVAWEKCSLGWRATQGSTFPTPGAADQVRLPETLQEFLSRLAGYRGQEVCGNRLAADAGAQLARLSGMAAVPALDRSDIETARCGAHNLPMYADEIDCVDVRHPQCEYCSVMCPETGSIDCSKSERGECSHDKAEELRDVAKLLAKLAAPEPPHV